MNSTAMNALNEYRRTGVHSQIMDASPHRLVQMLLEGAVGRLAAARGCMERGDHAGKGHAIGEVIGILGGLRDSLDPEKGGEVARNLEALYEYMSKRLVEANLANDLSMLDEVSSLLGEIKSGWDQIPAQH